MNVTKGLFIDSLEELNHKSRTKRLEKYTGCLYKEQVFYFSDFPGNKIQHFPVLSCQVINLNN